MEQEMMSLYDYLGYAARPALGAEVYQVAKQAKVRVETRYIKNKAYEGEVMLYPESFLREYFEMKQNG